MAKTQPATDNTKKPTSITSKTKSWANAMAKVLRPAIDQYDCVTVTQKNFKRIVTRGHSNVLVVFYADVQVYHRLLLIFQENKEPKLPLKGLVDMYSNRDSHVIVARCNVAENDVPVRIYHVPTIQLYPADRKQSPVEYFGEMEDINQYVDFIQTQGPQDPRFKPVSRTGSPTASEVEGNKEMKEQAAAAIVSETQQGETEKTNN
jgi:hypothetical protein